MIRSSGERNELFSAMAKARKAFKPVIKRSSNPFFKSKYADLAEILDATVEALSDNGLCISQFPSMDEAGHVIITTLVGHSSGQWMEADLPMPVAKADAQGTGSAITYGRRYAYGSVVNVASENDDDGNAASGRKAGEEPVSAVVPLSDDRVVEMCDWIKSSKDETQLKQMFAKAYAEAAKANDKDAQGIFIKAKDRRKQELADAHN